jgi:hypothetical protein
VETPPGGGILWATERIGESGAEVAPEPGDVDQLAPERGRTLADAIWTAARSTSAGSPPDWAEVQVPTLGWCHFRFTRPLGGKIRHPTVGRDALGCHVSFCLALERLD